MEREAAIDSSHKLIAQGSDTEQILTFLRAEGLSKIDSIWVLRRIRSLGLDEAKSIVHASDAWRDTRVRDDQLHTEAKAIAGKRLSAKAGLTRP